MLIVTQLIKKLPAFFYGARRIINVHNILPLVPILNRMYLVYTFPSYFPKIDSNIILPSTPTSSEWSLHFLSPTRTTYPTHLILLTRVFQRSVQIRGAV